MPYFIYDTQTGQQLTPLCATAAAAQEALIRREPGTKVCLTDKTYCHRSEPDAWRSYTLTFCLTADFSLVTELYTIQAHLAGYLNGPEPKREYLEQALAAVTDLINQKRA